MTKPEKESEKNNNNTLTDLNNTDTPINQITSDQTNPMMNGLMNQMNPMMNGPMNQMSPMMNGPMNQMKPMMNGPMNHMNPMMNGPMNQMNPMMNGSMNPMIGQMGYTQGMMGYGPNSFQYCEDPMKELSICTGAIIKQEIEMLEVYSGCETQNRYQVLIQSPMGIKFAFQCNEKSGCCSRCCCPNDCRSLEIIVRHLTSAAEWDTDLAKIFLRAEKPCALGCCCLCRPYMNVKLINENQYIGKVREPFTCCDRDVEIYNNSDQLKYRIVGDCCQLGFCCGSSAEKIIQIEFKILENNEIVGMMTKTNATLGEYFTKADSYKISFPNKATSEEKMLLIVAGLLIDYQNFEKDETPRQNLKKEGY